MLVLATAIDRIFTDGAKHCDDLLPAMAIAALSLRVSFRSLGVMPVWLPLLTGDVDEADARQDDEAVIDFGGVDVTCFFFSHGNSDSRYRLQPSLTS